MTNVERASAFARDILKQYTPETQPLSFWIFDIKGVEDAINRWKTAMPHVKPCFAVKCCPEPHLVKLLAELGCGFDCASIDEIKEVIKLGCQPDDITFSQTFKPYNQLIEADSLGICHTIVDSIEEIDKVAQYAPKMGVMLRVKENDLTAGHVFGDKFGVTDDEIPLCIKEIAKCGLKFDGVHFHVGSNSHNNEIFRLALQKARGVVTIAQEHGLEPYIVDIGGGFSQPAPFEQFASAIEDSIAALDFPKNFIFISEPGRYMASNSFHVVTSLHGKRVRTVEGKKRIEYVCGEGVHGAFGCCLWFEREMKCFCLDKDKENKETYDSLIYGPSCNGSDYVATGHFPEMTPGKDWLFFPNSGAYTISMASNFNGFESRFSKIYTLPSDDRKSVKIPEDLEKYSVPALSGRPGEWGVDN
ncbi:ornithine decarboxylase, putative [Entamoeba invadens IP1]|uniref:ornithine decarboxylase, putative n=1 Tax=Entamoeba invadens IP1 TaxID=370355 RepID=UPI0002C3F7CC|nr:ornithine decarboxylase, putative [Entamoeba invadens IP1]ELP85228.1 ornithine decarboxylase, putative [Entamoeba invadens IP1]|eukprot:XP_004184574.1 ornithine decarboxylase, putative [Entamoeba invadens IP1]